MANKKSSERPRTRFTSHNGLLDAEHNGLFERHWLKKLAKAGAPHWAVHPHGCAVSVLDAGWSADDYPHGCLSDGVLIMGNLLQGLDDKGDSHRQNASMVVRTAEIMAGICDRLGLEDAKHVVVSLASEVFEYRLQQYRVNGWPIPPDVEADLLRAELEAREELKRDWEAQMRDWGMPEPMISDAHAKHGHGLANGSWVCFPPDPK